MAWVLSPYCTVGWAVHLIPEPPLESPSFYVIQLSQEKLPIILLEKPFYNGSILISKLQEASGAEVTIRKSVKATAALLRQATSRNMKKFPVSLYAG